MLGIFNIQILLLETPNLTQTIGHFNIYTYDDSVFDLFAWWVSFLIAFEAFQLLPSRPKCDKINKIVVKMYAWNCFKNIKKIAFPSKCIMYFKQFLRGIPKDPYNRLLAFGAPPASWLIIIMCPIFWIFYRQKVETPFYLQHDYAGAVYANIQTCIRILKIRVYI